MSSKSILNNLLKQKTHNYLYVFFVMNPITVVVARLIIDKLNIDNRNILIISFRNTDLALLNYRSLFIKKNKVERIIEKLTLFSVSGNKIIKKINNRKFLLFTSWSYKEANWLLKSVNCAGHYYIEEGSAAYRIHNPYSFQKITYKTQILNNLKNRVNEGDEDDLAFRDDALGYIGIHDTSFSQISSNKKIILDNISDLKKIYKPKLIGVKYIGLTCAERRLKNGNWQEMIDKLIKKLPNNSFIKAHPSFTMSTEKIKSISDYVKTVSSEKTELCSSNIIIELEMLYEKKSIIGPESSLRFYAKLFGSDYQMIKLY
jgi:hypothetical protein